MKYSPAENQMTLICPLISSKVKCYKVNWKAIYDLHIWPLKVIKGHKVNWKIIYDFVYVLHTNIGHSIHRLRDIGLNR